MHSTSPFMTAGMRVALKMFNHAPERAAAACARGLSHPVMVWGHSVNPYERVVRGCRREEYDERFGTILAQLAQSRINLDTHLEGLGIREHRVTAPIVVEDKIEKLQAEEKERRLYFMQQAQAFGVITLFEKLLYGKMRYKEGKREVISPLEFYRELAGAARKDKVQATEIIDHYLALLKKESTIYYYIASLCFPIFNRVCHSVLAIDDSANTGTHDLIERIKTYFRDEKNIRLELLSLFNEIKDYFYKLRSFKQEWDALRKDPRSPHYSLTCSEYVTHRLQEDLVLSRRDPKVLKAAFNKRVISLLQIKSGIPFAGVVIDPLLNKILLIVMNRMDPIAQFFEAGFGVKETQNVTFACSIIDNLTLWLRQLKEKISTIDTAPLSSDEGSSANRVSLSGDEEAAFIKALHELLQYLPYQGEGVPVLFEGRSLQKGVEFMKTPLIECLKLTVSLCSNQEFKLQLWNDLLRMGGDLFVQPGSLKTLDHYDLAKRALQQEKDALIECLLDKYGAQLPSITQEHLQQSKLHELEGLLAGIIQESREEIEKFTRLLDSTKIDPTLSSLRDQDRLLLLKIRALDKKVAELITFFFRTYKEDVANQQAMLLLAERWKECMQEFLDQNEYLQDRLKTVGEVLPAMDQILCSFQERAFDEALWLKEMERFQTFEAPHYVADEALPVDDLRRMIKERGALVQETAHLNEKKEALLKLIGYLQRVDTPDRTRVEALLHHYKIDPLLIIPTGKKADVDTLGQLIREIDLKIFDLSLLLTEKEVEVSVEIERVRVLIKERYDEELILLQENLYQKLLGSLHDTQKRFQLRYPVMIDMGAKKVVQVVSRTFKGRIERYLDQGLLLAQDSMHREQLFMRAVISERGLFTRLAGG